MGHYEYETEDEIEAYEAAKTRKEQTEKSETEKRRAILVGNACSQEKPNNKRTTYIPEFCQSSHYSPNVLQEIKAPPQIGAALSDLNMQINIAEKMAHSILDKIKITTPIVQSDRCDRPKPLTLADIIADNTEQLSEVNELLSKIDKILGNNLGEDLKLE